MKLLIILVFCFGISIAQDQQPITIIEVHNPTSNEIQPTNQPFHQYGFNPQPPTLNYPISTLLPLQPTPTINLAPVAQQPVSRPPPPKVISTNIPVQASYQIADSPLEAAAHALPVQHSVIIHHGDYEPFQNIYSQQDAAPIFRHQNLPPVTRPIHPQFQGAIQPKQPLKPYVPTGTYQNPNHNVGKGLPYGNRNHVPYNAPRLNQHLQANVPIRGERQRLPVPHRHTTPPNLPYNFVAATVNPYLQPVQSVRSPAMPKPLPHSGALPVTPRPLPLPSKQQEILPKPLPSPYFTNLPATPRPLPLPPAPKPVVETNVEDKNEEQTKPKEEKEEKQSQEEEEDDEEESNEGGEEESEEEDDSEEASYERDYNPSYRNFYDDTEFDKRRYRPTFDAARYIFNEDSEEDEGEESEEEDRSYESPRRYYRYRERDRPRYRHGPYRRRPEKANRPNRQKTESSERTDPEMKQSRTVQKVTYSIRQ